MKSPLGRLLTSALAAASSRPPSSSTTTASFWHDVDRVRQETTALRPPPALLAKIQQAPWRGGLEPVDADQGIPWHACEVMEGQLPKDLQGRLVRNGPGRIRLPTNGQTWYQYGHWFDGDGFVTALTLHDNRTASFAGAYVQTDRFQAQQAFSGAGFAAPGAWTRRGQGRWWENIMRIATNPANTNVIFMDDKLYAVAEGGDPVPLNLETLATTGPAQPWKVPNGSETVQSFFSAHYSRDRSGGQIYNHGVQIGAAGISINIMQCNAQGQLLRQKLHSLPYLTFVHDNVLSENYLVLVVQPFGAPSTALLDAILGKAPLGQQLAWDTDAFGKDSVVMVFSKETLECVAQIPIGPVSTYHLVDAFESTGGEHNDAPTRKTLTLRLACHANPAERNRLEACFADLYCATDVPACELHEFVMDVAAESLVSRKRLVPDALPFELPDVNGGFPSYRKRWVYVNSRGVDADFVNSIQKLDLKTGTVSPPQSWPDGIAGAPIFVPKAAAQAEDDGYVFVPLYRPVDHKSDICILDASTMETVTRLRLQSHVPYQFHGAWHSTTSSA